MARRGVGQHGEAGVGEAWRAGRGGRWRRCARSTQPALLEAGDGVREAAARGQGQVGQLAHPQRAALGLGQPDEDLEVGVRHVGLALQLPVEGVEEHLRRLEVGPPGPLFVVGEPARRHGT